MLLSSPLPSSIPEKIALPLQPLTNVLLNSNSLLSMASHSASIFALILPPNSFCTESSNFCTSSHVASSILHSVRAKICMQKFRTAGCATIRKCSSTVNKDIVFDTVRRSLFFATSAPSTPPPPPPPPPPNRIDLTTSSIASFFPLSIISFLLSTSKN